MPDTRDITIDMAAATDQAAATRQRRINRQKKNRQKNKGAEAQKIVQRLKAKRQGQLDDLGRGVVINQQSGRGKYEIGQQLPTQDRFVARISGQLQREFNSLITSRKITMVTGKDRYGGGDGLASVHVNGAQYNFDKQDTTELQAYTDFRAMHLNINPGAAPHYIKERDKVGPWVRRLKAALTHEMGHLQFTIPLADLIAASKYTKGDLDSFDIVGKPVLATDGSDDAVFLDSHAADWGHTAWNVLEDQRMETAVVKHYPWAVPYFTNLMVSYIITDDQGQLVDTSWMMVGSRTYLPAKVRSLSAQAFNAWFAKELDIPMQDVLNDDKTMTPAGQWYSIVERYKAATTAADMMECVCEAAVWTSNLGFNKKDASHGMGSYTSATDEELAKRLKGGATGGGGKGGEDQGESGDAKSDGSGKSNRESKDGFDPLAPPSAGSGGDGSQEFSDNQLEDLLDQIKGMESSPSSAEEDYAVKDFVDNLRDGGLDDYNGSIAPLPAEFEDKAFAITTGIERALQSFVTANEPVWRSGMEKGVLEAVRYRTRDTGALDYRRNQDHSGKEGIDIHVSLLCDVSGSMNANMGALSGAVFAMSSACRNVGVGCDTILWSSGAENYRISDADAAEPLLYPAMGGTTPDHALADLAFSPIAPHVKNHLVIIFTDGAWGGSWYGNQNTLEDFRHQGDFEGERYFMVAKYGVNGAPTPGADATVELQDIMDLPDLMEEGLLSLLEK